MADKKDYKEIVEELPRQGWSVTMTTQGHWKAVPPDPTKTIIHFSTSDDHHALMNTLRDLRKQGFQWPPPNKNDIASQKRLTGSSASSLCPDCHQPLSEHEECLVAPPPPPPPPESPEARMDRLFAELKDAKILRELTEEHLRDCNVKMAEAQAALELAQRQYTNAINALAAKKQEFDAALGVAV